MELGVVLDPQKAEDILPMVKQSAYYEDFINLMHTFLGLMKSNAKSPEAIKAKMGDRRLSLNRSLLRPVP